MSFAEAGAELSMPKPALWLPGFGEAPAEPLGDSSLMKLVNLS